MKGSVKIAASEAQKKAERKYKAKLKQCNIKLNPGKEIHMKVYEVLEQKQNKNQYVIDLIIKDNNIE